MLHSPNFSCRYLITSFHFCPYDFLFLAKPNGVLPSCMCINTRTADVGHDMHTCSDVFNVCRLYSM